jgi:hypothetical protein
MFMILISYKNLNKNYQWKKNKEFKKKLINN